MRHTKTPWTVESAFDSDFRLKGNPQEVRDNMDFILRAVNNYDDLIATVKRLIDAIEVTESHLSCNDRRAKEYILQELPKAIQAIRRAEGRIK